MLGSCSNNEQTLNPIKLEFNQKDNTSDYGGKGALLLTRFKSLDHLKEVISISYSDSSTNTNSLGQKNSMVTLHHLSGGKEITRSLKTGVSQTDFTRAQEGGFKDRFSLLIKSPYSIIKRQDLKKVYALSRRRGGVFGEGDPAFYDLAESMMLNIYKDAGLEISPKDLSEKGYINTFNHFIAQALMTSIFDERLADFIADAHERYNMPTLITGDFTKEEMADVENGPTDNYVDIINNEWGQEFGKVLKEKHRINRYTYWTPALLSDYLNDIQSYFNGSFQIAFEPFTNSDEVIIRFTNKMNIVMGHDLEI